MHIAYKLILGLTTVFITDKYVERQMQNIDTIIEPPVSNVTIIIPSLNEEAHIDQCIESIKEQSIIQLYPEYFELLIADSQSTDNTVEIAKRLLYKNLSTQSLELTQSLQLTQLPQSIPSSLKNKDRIINVPRGKLRARNIAISLARGDIIVNVDADSIYNQHWLNTLLKPFKYDNTIVATNGSVYDYSIPHININIHGILDYFTRKTIYKNRIVGRNSAMKKDIFIKSGKFNDNIDQLNIHTIFQEEELDFGNRMSMFGKIVYIPGASCIHLGGQRILCRYTKDIVDNDNCMDIKNRTRF